jgi:short-subunit dehydrogenase
MFDLNVMTAVHASKAVVPAMIAAGCGWIVNVAAASSVRGQANMAAYAVAKNGSCG